MSNETQVLLIARWLDDVLNQLDDCTTKGRQHAIVRRYVEDAKLRLPLLEEELGIKFGDEKDTCNKDNGCIAHADSVTTGEQIEIPFPNSEPQ